MATLFQVEEFIVGLSMAVGAADIAGAAVLVGTAKWVGAADIVDVGYCMDEMGAHGGRASLSRGVGGVAIPSRPLLTLISRRREGEVSKTMGNSNTLQTRASGFRETWCIAHVRVC